MSSKKTPNLELHEWVPDDYVQMEEFNENFRKLDENVGGLANIAEEVNLKVEEVAEKLSGDILNISQETSNEIGKVTQQLAQNATQLLQFGNAGGVLQILSPYNHYENIHPKVLYFENGWNGYKFWMAYTPYKLSDIKEENPCIAVSNDGIKWTIPQGLVNPLDPWPGSGTQYHNDTHLLYRSDINRLEIWYRTADTGNKIGYLKRKVSTDGVNWGATEILASGTVESDDHISPAVIYEDDKYRLLSVYKKSGSWTVNYRDSSDAKTWSPRQDIKITLPSTTQLWHLDFIKTNIGYEMVVTGFNVSKGETTNTANLYHTTSQDLINWENPKIILKPSGVAGAFDGAGIYRSSIVKIKDKYYLYYSGVGLNAERGISLATGESATSLVGQTITDSKQSVLLGDTFLEKDEAVLNKVNVKQKGNPTRYGHMGVGVLTFEDRLTNSTTPKNGSIGYSALLGILQKYIDGSWRGINTTAFYKKTSAQTLTSAVVSTIVFNSPLTTSSKYNTSTGLYTPAGEEFLKISAGVTIADALEGDIELLIVNGSDVTIGYLQRKKIHSINGIEYLNGQFVMPVSEPFKIAIRYTGTNTPRITQYVSQNYLLIENI